MAFTDRVISYIKANYDIPNKMEFYIGNSEYDFEDWVDAYIEEFNGNVNVPFDDSSDESEVEAVGDEILQIMTSPYNPYSPNKWTINYADFIEDDYGASAKKSVNDASFTDMVAKQRDKNKGIQKNTTVSYFYDGMEEREEIPDMMDVDTAEKLIKNRLLSPYTNDDVITALFSVMSNGNVEKYKKLWIERFQEDY